MKSRPIPVLLPLLFIVGGVVLVTAVRLFDRERECPQSNPEIVLIANGYRLQVELAATESSRRCGLAARDVLPPDSGMLFAYDDEQNREFWMKDTRIPLAIAFLSANKEITEILDMTPDVPKRIYRSRVPARYALETNPEWFASHGIAVGDQVQFELPPGLAVEGPGLLAVIGGLWGRLLRDAVE